MEPKYIIQSSFKDYYLEYGGGFTKNKKEAYGYTEQEIRSICRREGDEGISWLLGTRLTQVYGEQ